MRRELRLATLFTVGSVLLLPWSAYLGHMLPSQHESSHWDIAWVGFDLALAAVLGLVGISAARRSAWLEGAATAAATLLFVDAWFDVLTARTMSERLVALLEAGLAEIPLAFLCLWLARTAKHALETEPRRERADSSIGRNARGRGSASPAVLDPVGRRG